MKSVPLAPNHMSARPNCLCRLGVGGDSVPCLFPLLVAATIPWLVHHSVSASVEASVVRCPSPPLHGDMCDCI